MATSLKLDTKHCRWKLLMSSRTYKKMRLFTRFINSFVISYFTFIPSAPENFKNSRGAKFPLIHRDEAYLHLFHFYALALLISIMYKFNIAPWYACRITYLRRTTRAFGYSPTLKYRYADIRVGLRPITSRRPTLWQWERHLVPTHIPSESKVNGRRDARRCVRRVYAESRKIARARERENMRASRINL